MSDSSTDKSSMEFDLENPLENLQDLHSDAVSSLFLIESDHIPQQSFFQILKARDLDISSRTEAISLISQLSCTWDPILSYVAINYFDRFLVNQGILQPKQWVLRLIAISCFSLAAKMMKTEYSASDTLALVSQCDGGMIFEKQTIQKMEALVLGALKWRMRSITPFSFLAFFITQFKLKDPSMETVLKNRAAQIIFKSQREIRFWEFKPSIVAASALLSASHELFPFQYPCFLTALSECSYVNKESVLQCYGVIQDMAIEEENGSVINAVPSSDTPVNVLDHHFLSSESHKTNEISIAVFPQRGKITVSSNDSTSQNSQIKPS